MRTLIFIKITSTIRVHALAVARDCVERDSPGFPVRCCATPPRVSPTLLTLLLIARGPSNLQTLYTFFSRGTAELSYRVHALQRT